MGIFSAETAKVTAQTKTSLADKYAQAEASDKGKATAAQAASRGGRRV